jgi:hypothetical protein
MLIPSEHRPELPPLLVRFYYWKDWGFEGFYWPTQTEIFNFPKQYQILSATGKGRWHSRNNAKRAKDMWMLVPSKLQLKLSPLPVRSYYPIDQGPEGFYWPTQTEIFNFPKTISNTVCHRRRGGGTRIMKQKDARMLEPSKPPPRRLLLPSRYYV